MAASYIEKIAQVQKAFEDDYDKAGALFEAFNAVTDRIFALENENARLTVQVAHLFNEVARLNASQSRPS